MPEAIHYEITHRCASTQARSGLIHTPHGSIAAPAFMTVGTQGAVKGIMPRQILDAGADIILVNAYHLMLRPGDERIAGLGGCHAFMRWKGPLLSDSGGYQVYSMADINAVHDDGVRFTSHIDGSSIDMSPERSMQVQNNLGADIIMAFDDCPPSVEEGGSASAGPSSIAHHDRLREANKRTVRWLTRCASAHTRPTEQALFGIVQGGTDLDLRAESVEAVCNVDLPGYAIGGLGIGEEAADRASVVAWTAERMPDSRPRYLMGVGYERDIVAAVQAGVDMFDCVLPTRNGRNGQAFTRSGRLHLRNACHANDKAVIEPGCSCHACGGGFSRAYLRHLFASREMLGPILVALHNIHHYMSLMVDIRKAIRDNAWSPFGMRWPIASGDPQEVG